MTLVTLAALVASGVAPTQARIFVVPLALACARFDIDTAARVAAFVAQCRVESANFTALEEGLYYRKPERIRAVFSSFVPSLHLASQLTRRPEALANVVYANRLGNGNVESGDGWRHRGRGLFQLTGRSNYLDAAIALGQPYVDAPSMVAEPMHAALTAAWYWHRNKLNVLADAGLTDPITKAINGPAMMHAELRRQYTDEGARAFVA